MSWPFTGDFLSCFIAAQAGGALMLTALLLFWRFNRLSRGALLAGIWLSALVVGLGPTLELFAYKPGPHLLRNTLALSAALGTAGAMLERRPIVALLAALGETGLWFVTDFVSSSDAELSALHLAWLGLTVGLLCRRAPLQASASSSPSPATAEGSYAVHDTVVFLVATLLAALVCLLVLRRGHGSADEWAYTFQAAVLAKGRAYALADKCQPYLQSVWVFDHDGRLFSQYPPGWPLFMAPFVWLRSDWMAAPVSMGLMAVGIGRLARSAMRVAGRDEAPASPRTIRAAGTWAAALSMLATTILLNGASRFPHVYVVALYAWSLEALLRITTPGLTTRAQVGWGLVLGAASITAVASRPADGAFVGFGLAALFVYWLVRRRIRWRSVAAASFAFLTLGTLVAVLLRLQLGVWFKTGYSIGHQIHPYPFTEVRYSIPARDQWKYGLPLAVGTYCWWPCSMALGLAGLATLRGRAVGLAIAIALGALPYVGYLTALDFSRNPYFEYGPRYLSILLVPMAVGGGVALAPLTTLALRASAGRSALMQGSPLAIAVIASGLGWLITAPLVWQTAVAHTRQHSALERAIEDAHLHNAIVIAADGTTPFDTRDLTTNYPLDLYPNQDVIKAAERGDPEHAASCLRSEFPGRAVYRASGSPDVKLAPAR